MWYDTAAPGSTSLTNSADVATFSAAIANGWGLTATPIIINSATQNISGLTFTGSAGNYTIGTTGGNALKLSSGGTIQILGPAFFSNAIETINAPLILQGTTYTFANNSANNGGGSGTLLFGGGITGVTGATVLTISGSNTTANTLRGVIGNGTATSLAITKSGSGTWILSGANTYSGITTVSAGVLNIRHASALGTVAAGTVVTSGAALQLQGGITTLAEALTLNGNGISTDGALRNINGNNTYAGLITLGSATRINSDVGTLTLSNSGTITGDTFGLAVGGSGNMIINSIIGMTGGTLTKNGTGTLTLYGANTYSGTTTVSIGVLNIRNASALGDVAAGTSVTFAGAALQIQGGITTLAEALSLNGNGVNNTGALRNISEDNTYAGLLTLGYTSRINSDSGTLILSNTGAITGGIISLTVGGAGNTTIQSILSAELGSLYKDGSGTLLLAGASLYTGATLVNGGTLKAGVASVAGVSGAFGVNSLVTMADAAGVTLDLNGFNTQIGGLSGGGTTGGNVTLGAATLTVAGSATPLPFAGILSGVGGALTKSGTGTLILTGANTYTGATTISGGILQLGNGGTSGSLSASSSLTNNATLIFNRSNSVTQGTDFAGVISGSGAVRQNGPGTLTFVGANTYTGRTTLNGGTLVLSFGTVTTNIIASNSALTLGGGTLQLSGTGTQTLNGLTTTTGTGSKILLGTNQTLTLGALVTPSSSVALNFNTAAGGANGATVGTGVVVLTGQTAGSAISSGFTVTDAGGFGLATVNVSNQIVRLTTTTLLPVTGSSSATNYRIDNNAGASTVAGSSSLAITTSEAAKSLTVDTTTASGLATLSSGVVLSTNIWNFGGSGTSTNTWSISGSASGAGLQSLASGNSIEINNYNVGKVTFNAPILASGSNAVTVKGTGTTVFGGVNTYTGNTTVRGGTLEVATGGSITLASADVIVGSASGDNGTLNITGGIVSNSSGTIGNSVGSTGTVRVSSGSWTSSFYFTLGGSGSGVLNISGTGTVSTAYTSIGSMAGSSGIVAVSGGSWTNSTSLTIGDYGSGVLNISGTGTVNASSVVLGGSAGGSGVVNVSSGSLINSSYFTIGSFGSGVVNISGGSVSNSSATVGSGTVTVSSGSWTSADLTVGNGGIGVLKITGGTVSNTTGLFGTGESSLGTATISGGTWSNSGLLEIGSSGTGVLNINGGSVSSAGGSLGSGTNGSGTATVSSGSWTSSSNLTVGSSGTGVLNITGGSVSSLNGFLGGNAGGNGTATVSGGSWINNGSLAVGSANIGVLNVTGNGIVYVGGVGGTGTLTLGGSAGSSGVLNLGSGGVAGTINAASVTTNFGVGVVNFNQTGSYTFAPTIAGSLDLNKLGSGTTTLANTNTYSGTTSVSDGQLHVNASLNSTSAVNVGEAAGTLGTYSSATNSFTGQNAAVLSGNSGTSIGSISSTVTIGSDGVGILSPGGSLGANNGTLTINHDLLVSSGSMIELGITTPTVAAVLSVASGGYSFNGTIYSAATDLFNPDFGGTSANSVNAGLAASTWNVLPSSSSNHDYISVTGMLTLNNGSKVHVVQNGSVTYKSGQVFNLIDWGTIINNGFTNPTGFTSGGIWGDFYLPDLSSTGLLWDTSAFLSTGVLVVAPEPSRMVLLLFCLFSLVFRRRRNRFL